MWTCKNRNSMIIYVHTSNGILKFKFNFRRNIMKRILLAGMILINSAFLSASSLDEAAKLLNEGQITEQSLKENFSVRDFQEILEKSRRISLENSKKQSNSEKINLLLRERNKELEIKLKENQNKSKPSKPNIEETVNRVYRGLYGDNPERVKKLRDLGFNSQEIKKIQAEVNKLVEKEKQ